MAASAGSTCVVEALLERGARIDQTTEDGNTALNLAAWKGHTSIVNVMLDKGAKVDLANKSGHTALTFAASAGHTSAVEVLLHGGAKIDHATVAGDTALIHAALNGHTNVVIVLLQRGAKIDLANAAGDMALIYAARNGHGSVVEVLLGRGAPEAMKIRATTVAHEAGHEDIVTLLRNHTDSPISSTSLQRGTAARQVDDQEEADLRCAIELSLRVSATVTAPPSRQASTVSSSRPLPHAGDRSGSCPGAPPPAPSSGAADRAPAQPAAGSDTRARASSLGECIVCLEDPKAAVCVPCGHNALCMMCADKVLKTSRKCPVCRQPIREVIKLYRVS